MSEININSNNHSDIEISENNFIDVELDNGEIENIETEISEPDCIEIEINGLMSSNSFIGLEDTPMYYIDGKFFKVEGNKLVYADIDWADITGDIKGNPELEDQIKEIASQYSKEFIIESVNTAVQKHNLDEKSHPFLIDMILNNYASINKKVDEGLGLVNTRVDNLELTTNQNTDNINILLDEQADINQALNNIEYDVVKNASDIANLTPRVTNNENKIVELNEKIKDIAGADLTELNNKVNKNSGDITNLTQKVDNNYHELSLNAQNNFDILNNKIADNSIKINTNTQDIADIKLKSITDYTELKNKINSNSTKIDTNSKDIYQNTLTINENTLAIADNSKLINSTIENLKSYSKTSAFAKVAFSGEYTDLLNTPDIPSIDGLASTNYVNEYVNNAISGVVGLKFIVVDKLPEVGKNGYIYLVPDSKSTQDVYTEYIWLEDQQRFEQFGLSEVNLENYYTKDIVDTFLDTKVDKVAGKSLVSDTEINRLKNVKNYDDTEIKNSLDSKQDILIAGENIDITQNVISSVDTKYTAGEGINISKDNIISNTQTSAEWGKISGDINTQVDLVNKLDSKQNTLTEANAGNGISIENGIITNTKTETSWGEIKGDINSQLDLKKELDNKQDINSLSINGVVLNNNKTLNELGIQPQGDYVTQAEFPKDITTQGNTFNGPNQLVQLLNDGTLPRLDASNLYNVYGEKGEKGDKGDTSTIEVGSVVKGDVASVTNVGTKTDAIFDFVLPKGDKGDQGIQGPVGPQGKGANNGTQLTNQNLDTYKTEPLCGYYYAGGGNTVKPKPSGVDAFGLWVLRVAVGFYQQELHTANTNTNKVYIRTWNSNSWTPWVEKGVKGDTGARGPQGEQGPRGEKGETGDGYSDAYHMYMTGNVTNDERGYKQLVDMRYSTFDKSKFTVVGTPTITDDGIASGFTRQNYIKKSITLKRNNQITFSVKFKYYKNEQGKSQPLLWFYPKSGGRTMYLSVTTRDGLITALYDVGYNDVPNLLTEGSEYELRYETDLISYYNIYLNDKPVIQQAITGGVLKDIDYVVLGDTFETPTDVHNKCLIDLKQFSISVDGKEVFSGNKTGIDVIKKDNFTVVGSPTITDDGIASGFSKDNYIKITQQFDFTKPFVIEGKFTTKEITSNPEMIFSTTKGTGNTEFMLAIQNNKFILYHPTIVGTGTRFQFGSIAEPNTTYYFKVDYNNGLKCFISKSKNSLVDFLVEHNVIFNDIYDYLNLGMNVAITRPFTGSIDLNSFKIYVDSNLVYQPCLKIPYTESKTGSKIVDSIYRDRVKQVYEENGKALYYTIDEANKDITLPAGEIYGMLGEGGSGGTGNPDNLTITINKNNALQAEGVLERNKKSAKFDWVGTLNEYETQKIATTHPEWICYITDDVSGGENVYTKDQVNKLFSNTANKDLANITELGKENIKKYSDSANKNLSNLTEAGMQVIKDNSGGAGHMVGELIAFPISTKFTPEGFIKPDGTEFTQGLFPDLWQYYLHPITIGEEQVTILDVCTYEEYANEVNTKGACTKWAVDDVRKTFKVPFIPNSRVSWKKYKKLRAKGNGMTVGLTNGTDNYGLGTSSLTYGPLLGTKESYGQPVRTETRGGSSVVGWHGITQDSAKSGIEADFSSLQSDDIEVEWFIYVANAQIGQSAIDWSRFETAVAGKLNKDHSNDTVPYLKTSYVNGNSGYRIWSDGYCEQWGIKNQVIDTNISLLKKYKDTNYIILATWNGTTSSSNGASASVVDTSTIRLGFSQTTSNVIGGFWKTCGYLAEGEY